MMKTLLIIPTSDIKKNSVSMKKKNPISINKQTQNKKKRNPMKLIINNKKFQTITTNWSTVTK